MKLSQSAKKNSIYYLTAYRHWRKGFIRAKQLASGTTVVTEEDEVKAQAEEKRTIQR
jgi:predicted site-specific integrase-resolvase